MHRAPPPLSAIASCLEVFEDFLKFHKDGDFIINRNGLKNEDLRLGKGLTFIVDKSQRSCVRRRAVFEAWSRI